MKQDLPLVSIVIPAYNLSRYLAEAIQSVLNQDYHNIELIVLDDGSTDDTQRVLEKYNGQFYWESQQNMGQANTLNKGWRMSKGEILSYLSADDVLLPNAVSSSVNCFLNDPDAVLTYCDFNLIDPDSSIIRRVRTPKFDYREMLAKMICPPGPGAFFRRAAFESAGPWDSSIKQLIDYEYWLRLGLQGCFLRIPEVLAGYRVHEASQTFAAHGMRAEEPVLIIKRFFETHSLPHDLIDLKNQALSSACLLSFQLYLRAGQYRLGYASLCRAFSLYPRNLFTLRAARLALNVLFNRIGHRILWRIKRLLDRYTWKAKRTSQWNRRDQ
ncbi:MAG: glycosyltransferase family 2 protein [Planctomycetota bacterium]|jgi:glycosyltransferase involved in cell wall biosynthesis